jgi:hypothetical protein
MEPLFESTEDLRTPASVYSARLPKESEDGNLILFGEVTTEYTYNDGTHPESHFSISRHLWEQAGKPEHIYVFFSAEEFTAISTDAYLKLSERLREVADTLNEEDEMESEDYLR